MPTQLDIWKQYDATEFFNGITIPDDWDTLEDFVEWYMESKIPIMIPFNAEVIRSDDAVAICVFRKGNYQVEFYLEYPKMYIRRHAHPRMEVITMELGGGGLSPGQTNNLSKNWGTARKKLMPGEYHGGDTTTVLSTGFCTLAFQKWENSEEMTSAAVHWKGELQGPIQAKLIKEHQETALVKDGYADVSVTIDKN